MSNDKWQAAQRKEAEFWRKNKENKKRYHGRNSLNRNIGAVAMPRSRASAAHLSSLTIDSSTRVNGIGTRTFTRQIPKLIEVYARCECDSLGSMRDADAGYTPLYCVGRNTRVRIKVGWNIDNVSGEPR